MEWSKVFGLIPIICFLGAIAQLLRFRNEIKKIDKCQELTDKLAKEWKKRLYWVIFFGVLGLIFLVIAFVIQILHVD